MVLGITSGVKVKIMKQKSYIEGDLEYFRSSQEMAPWSPINV